MPEPVLQHIAVYPGSFDPITMGHLEVVTRASRLFGKVILAVAGDAEKDHMFTVHERIEMARDACRDIPNIAVDSFEGLVVDYARAQGAQTLIKGLRAVSDFEREMQMATMNRQLAPELDTLYLMAMPEYTFLSSSIVKHVHQLGGDISRLVTPFTRQLLDRRLEG